MRKYNRIKGILAIVALSFLGHVSQSWADGGVGTGGGNLIPAKPNHKPYLPEAEKILLEIRPMARVELNQLRNWYSCDPRTCATDPFMTARAKLLSDPIKTRKLIDSVNINILKNEPCSVVEDGILQHRTSSATLPNNICFSLSEIGKYDVSSESYNHLKRMLRGLFFHELTHLLGGNEIEAVAIQKIIAGTEGLGADSIYANTNIQMASEDLKRAVKEFDQLLLDISSNKTTELAVCSKMTKLYYNAIYHQTVTLSEQEEWIFNRAINRLILATQGYCETADSYKRLFGTRLKISELEFQLKAIENRYDDSSMTEIELERAHRLSSNEVVFHNLSQRSQKLLRKELVDVKNDLDTTFKTIQLMKKF
ncbi:MAG: hypothetical protein AABY64_11135 [Bdellovibrionota bacterium]